MTKAALPSNLLRPAQREQEIGDIVNKGAKDCSSGQLFKIREQHKSTFYIVHNLGSWVGFVSLDNKIRIR